MTTGKGGETVVLDQHGKYVHLSVKDCIAIEYFLVDFRDDKEVLEYTAAEIIAKLKVELETNSTQRRTSDDISR